MGTIIEFPERVKPNNENTAKKILLDFAIISLRRQLMELLLNTIETSGIINRLEERSEFTNKHFEDVIFPTIQVQMQFFFNDLQTQLLQQSEKSSLLYFKLRWQIIVQGMIYENELGIQEMIRQHIEKTLE